MSLHQPRRAADRLRQLQPRATKSGRTGCCRISSQLGQLGILQVWDDRQIKAGVDWYARIREVLSKTPLRDLLDLRRLPQLVLLHGRGDPLPLQQRYRGEGSSSSRSCSVHCVWEAHPWLKRWQMLPRDARPVLTYFAHDPDQCSPKSARQVVALPGNRQGSTIGRSPAARRQRSTSSACPRATTSCSAGGGAELLNKAWDDQQLNVVVLVASGGVGKSTLVRAGASAMEEDNYRGAERVFAWSFYSQGTGERVTSADEFIAKALEWFGDETGRPGPLRWDRGYRLAELIQRRRTLLLLDGLEPLQSGQASIAASSRTRAWRSCCSSWRSAIRASASSPRASRSTDLADDEIKAAVRQVDLDQISTVGRSRPAPGLGSRGDGRRAGRQPSGRSATTPTRSSCSAPGSASGIDHHIRRAADHSRSRHSR